MKNWIILFGVFVGLAIPVLAQEDPRPLRDGGLSDSRDWLKNAWNDFKEPIATDTNKILVGGLLGTGVLLATRNNTVDALQESWSTRKPLGGSADFFRIQGEWIPNLSYAAGMMGVGYWQNQINYYGQAGLMFRATLYAGALTTLLKVTVRQPRPNDPEDRKSYPSGHTTTAFAFASVVGHQHGWKWGVPAYILAAGAGMSRINDNKHYLHDVVMGASIGTAYGIALSRSYNKSQITAPKVSDVNKGYTFSWLPLLGGQEIGFIGALNF